MSRYQASIPCLEDIRKLSQIGKSQSKKKAKTDAQYLQDYFEPLCIIFLDPAKRKG